MLLLVACMQMLLLQALPLLLHALLLLMRQPILMLLGWGRGEAGGRWGEPLALEEDGLAGLPRWLPPITAPNTIHTSIASSAHSRVPRLLL